MRTPYVVLRRSAASTRTADRLAALRARQDSGRARSSVRYSVAYELTRTVADACAPQREHQQRVAALRRPIAKDVLGAPPVDDPVELRGNLHEQRPQLAVQPARHRWIEALLRPPREGATEPPLD